MVKKNQKSHWVFQAWILSLGCNMCLLGVIYYLCMREANAQSFIPYQMCTSDLKESAYPKYFLNEIRHKSFQEIVHLLDNPQLVEGKISVQECALWVLIHDYEISVERLLGFSPAKKRYGKIGLKEEEFSILAELIEQEKYPFTFKKCVEIFCKNPVDHDLRAWVLNAPQIYTLKTVAKRCGGIDLTEVSILKLLVEAGPLPIVSMHEEIKECGEWTKTVWQRFLVRCVEASSKTASYLLVVSNLNAEESLEERTQLKMLSLMDEKTSEAAEFVQKLLERPTLSDSLRERALKRHMQFNQ